VKVKRETPRVIRWTTQSAAEIIDEAADHLDRSAHLLLSLAMQSPKGNETAEWLQRLRYKHALTANLLHLMAARLHRGEHGLDDLRVFPVA